MKNSVLVFLIGLIMLLGVSNACMAESEQISFQPLPELQADKARLFFAAVQAPIIDNEIPKRDFSSRLFSNYAAFDGYSFNIVTRNGEQLAPLAKLRSGRNKFPHRKFYLDVDAGAVSLVAFPLNDVNFGAMTGYPGLVDLTLEPGISYQLALAWGPAQGQMVPPLAFVATQLDPEQFARCASVREQEPASSGKLESNYFDGVAFNSNIEWFSCVSVFQSQAYAATEKQSAKLAKWVSKKQPKLIKAISKREQHNAAVEAGLPTTEAGRRRLAMKQAKEKRKQEKAARWAKLREEKARKKAEKEAVQAAQQ